MASLAIDYGLAGGLKPEYFHASTFFWFLVLIGALYFFFEIALDRSTVRCVEIRSPALCGAAIFGLHPVAAETVNYIVQRADLYATLGTVLGLLLWAKWPLHRRYGFYLLPPALAMLSKPPALIFPLLLLGWVYMVQTSASCLSRYGQWLEVRQILRQCAPAFVLAGVAGILHALMTPATWIGSATSAAAYRFTQPWVALRSFGAFLIPTGLNADSDLQAFDRWYAPEALLGWLFIVVLVWITWQLARHYETRVVAFGLFWFLVTGPLIGATIPLSEVENTHRMFFPLAGLVLVIASLVEKLRDRPVSATLLPDAVWRSHRRILILLPLFVLLAESLGTWRRNEAWRTEETLWKEVTEKSPHNGRGLMNYGLTRMSSGHPEEAQSLFERAAEYAPNYAILEINLGIVNGVLGRQGHAMEHFQRALHLAPNDAQTHFYFARWLLSQGPVFRLMARNELAEASKLNPEWPAPQELAATIQQAPK
jgi:hypothetical protein